MDLSKISTADLQAISKQQWDKVSTPGLQEYQNQLQHESHAQTQALNPQRIPDAADKAAQAGLGDKAQAVSNQPDSPLMQYLKKGVSAVTAMRGGLLNAATAGNFDPSQIPGIGKGFQQAEQENPVPYTAGKAAGGMALGSLAGAGAAGVIRQTNALARIGTNALTGAALGGAQNPGENGSRLSNALTTGLAAGGTSAALEGGSAVLKKIGDYLMQRSVGMRKYFPGTGEKLADLGVVGTKNMMANQVQNKYDAEESKLQDIVKDLSGTVNSSEIADAISQKAKQFTLPSKGVASPFTEPDLQKVRDAAEKVSGLGDLAGDDLLALKRTGDYAARTKGGDVSFSTDAEIANRGANAARAALKKMSPAAADSLLNEQALIRANQALQKPETIHQRTGSSLFFGKLPGQSLLGSLAGQSAVKTGQAAGTLADPTVLQSLFESVKGIQQNQPPNQ